MPDLGENLRLSSRLIQELYHKYAFDMYDNMPYGYAILKVIEVEKDYGEVFFIYANSAFLSMTGSVDIDIKGCSYSEAMGRLSKNVYRNLRDAARHNEKYIFFENVKENGPWFDVLTFPALQEGYCAMALFDSFALDSNFIANEDLAEADRVIVKIAKMIHSTEDDFEINMHRALRFLGESLRCERTIITEYFHAQPIIRYEWEKDPLSEEELAPELILERFQYVEQWLESNNVLIVEDSYNAQNEPVYELLRSKGIKNTIMVPYLDDYGIVGCLIVDNYKVDNICAIKYLVETTAITIFSEIHSKRLVEKLTFMGTHDQLTNVNNRNALNMRIYELDGANVPVGIAYADVNGLKMINDTIGHDAGDARIIKMASILSKVFMRKDIFRVGGDEFVVIVQGIEKEEFISKIDQLKRLSKQLENGENAAANSNVNMFYSLGYVWEENCSELEALLKKADELMYEEKKKYYSIFGHDRRKDRR